LWLFPYPHGSTRWPLRQDPNLHHTMRYYHTRRPATLNRYVYVANNAVNYIDPRGLEGGEPGGICPECKEYFRAAPSGPPPRHDPHFGGPYIPLEWRLGTRGRPLAATWIGGQFWLPAAVERDPLVHHVYIRLRTELELWPAQRGYMPITTLVCKAVDAAQEMIGLYAPDCGSSGIEDCDRIVVRMALNGLAAAARRTIQGRLWPIVPNIAFEYEESRGSVEDIWEQVFPRLEGPAGPFALSEWDTGEGSYALEYDAGNPLEGDKAVHFLTHAFMACEQRWTGIDPYTAWARNDWQGRALEQITEVANRFGYEETYSVDDVIANRWGTAFGLGAFDNPELLIGQCKGLACRIPGAVGS